MSQEIAELEAKALEQIQNGAKSRSVLKEPISPQLPRKSRAELGNTNSR